MNACPVCTTHAIGYRRRTGSVMFRCTNRQCNHIYCWPQPDDNALKAFYAAAYYNNRIPVYSQTSMEISVQLLDLLPEIDGPLLDMGCGEGDLYKSLPDTAKHYYTGVEPDPLARRRAREATRARIVENIENLSGNRLKFKIMIMNQVIEHVRNPVECLGTLRTLSKPGAVLLVTTVNMSCLKSRILGRRWEQFRNRTHLHLFSQRSLRQAMIRGGWDDVQLITTPLVYPHHGRTRRQLHRILRWFRLDGNLMMTARTKGAANET